MMRSLWTAASGMNGEQFHIDTIANNLSNVNTVGFKKLRAEFDDLLYQTIRIAGTPATESTVVPTPTQVGHGVKTVASQRLFSQGSLQATDNPSDLAIQGEGFFRILTFDGTYGYTRDGTFKVDSDGQLVTSQGYRVLPEIVLPRDYLNDSLAVTRDGRVSVMIPGNDEPVQVGQLELYRFTNPAGLQAVGENLLKVTPASGDAVAGRPGFDGMGQLQQRFVEMSNVSVVKEMVNMIVAQRAYEFNSKAIQTSDNMLGIAANLKRG